MHSHETIPPGSTISACGRKKGESSNQSLFCTANYMHVRNETVHSAAPVHSGSSLLMLDRKMLHLSSCFCIFLSAFPFHNDFCKGVSRSFCVTNLEPLIYMHGHVNQGTTGSREHFRGVDNADSPAKSLFKKIPPGCSSAAPLFCLSCSFSER